LSDVKVRTLIDIPEDVYAAYAAQASALAAAGGSATPQELMGAQLARFSAYPASNHVLVVDSENRGKLDQVLQGGMLRDAQDLVEKVTKLADIQIGGIAVHWTPGQLRQIKTYATRNRLTVEETVKRIVFQMSSQFWDYIGD
jgi:hypothetical protein